MVFRINEGQTNPSDYQEKSYDGTPLDDNQNMLLRSYGIIGIIVYALIFMLAINNIVRYISKNQKNKFLTKVFYALACLECVTNFVMMIYLVVDA